MAQNSNAKEEGQTIVEEKVVKFNGDICIKKYLKGKFLGKGGFAKCYEFQNLENKKIQAAKIIMKNSLTKSRAKQKLMSEIKIHRSLHHNNIVGFEHFFEDSENVYILLELCQNQSLNELLRRRKRLHEIEVQCYVN
jgi:polo-like kinase 1